MFQMGHVGPMLGQAHHFRGYAPEKIPYAIERYTDEAARLYGIMDWRLSEAEYFAGEEYTIADMAIYPWLVSHERQGQDLEDYPDLQRWYEGMESRAGGRQGAAPLAGRHGRRYSPDTLRRRPEEELEPL